jgi:hypothetical protein
MNGYEEKKYADINTTLNNGYLLEKDIDILMTLTLKTNLASPLSKLHPDPAGPERISI